MTDHYFYDRAVTFDSIGHDLAAEAECDNNEAEREHGHYEFTEGREFDATKAKDSYYANGWNEAKNEAADYSAGFAWSEAGKALPNPSEYSGAFFNGYCESKERRG